MSLPPGTELIPTWLLYTFAGGTILAMLLLLTLFFTLFKTPATTWLKAMLFNRDIFFKFSSRDGQGGFSIPLKRTNNFCILPRQGVFGITKGSHIFDRSTKRNVYLVDTDFSGTVQLTWPNMLEQLKKMFPDMKNGKDLKKIVTEAGGKPKGSPQNPEIKVKEGKTINVSDLTNYYPLNTRPEFVESYGEICKREERKKLDVMKNVFTYGILFIIICVGCIILYTQFKVCPDARADITCDFGDAISQACGEDYAKKAGLQSIDKKDTGVITEVKSVAGGKPGGTLS